MNLIAATRAEGGLVFYQIYFGPNIFLTKTTSMSTNTTTIKMGFDTIEINLVGIMFGKVVLS